MLGWNIVDSFQVGSEVFVPDSSLLSNSWLDDRIFSSIVDVDLLSFKIAEGVYVLKILSFSLEGIEVDRGWGNHARGDCLGELSEGAAVRSSSDDSSSYHDRRVSNVKLGGHETSSRNT